MPVPRSILSCPHDGGSLESSATTLRCGRDAGHVFPVVHGVPVLLRSDVVRTHDLWWTVPADVERLAATAQTPPAPGTLDPFVERWLVATCGLLYRHCKLPLARYPIPEIAAAPRPGALFLDVGSNWGRWALAAARAGYRAVAVDPSLEAALAGARIARQLGLPVEFVVGDARHLPLADGAFDVVFSYSVLQHLEKTVVKQAATEMARVARAGGLVRAQFANVLGARRLQRHAAEWTKRQLTRLAGRPRRPPYGFRVRPWTPGQLMSLFEEVVGPTEIRPDAFFTLNCQTTDVDLLQPRYAAVVRASAWLSRASTAVPVLQRFADSVWVESSARHQ